MSLSTRFSKVASDPDAPIGPRGETALHLAAQEGDAQVATQAIAAGATAFVMDNLNNSPLIYAALRDAADVIRVIVKSDNKGIDYSGNLGTALGIAAQEGNIEATRALLDGGANIDAPDDMGSTPLMNAVYAEEKEMVQFLLERGANANILRMNEGALHLAVRKANMEILDLLLASDAKQHLHQQTQAQKLTPLHIAVMTEQHAAAEKLIAAGALTNFENAQGETVLAMAARKDDAKMIRILVGQGHADLRHANDLKYTALHIAVLGGKLAAAKELVRLGADPEAKDQDGRTALAIAREKEDAELISLLEGKNNSVILRSFPKSAAPSP